MKTINYIFLALLVGFVSSCIQPEDKVTADAKEIGVVLDKANASGKMLGLPNPDETVTFLDVAVDYSIEVFSGDASSVGTYKVVKTFDGAAGTETVEVATFNEVPYSVSFATMGEILQDFSVSEGDLRIGDVITFSTYFVTADGEYKASPGTADLAISVNCLSALAGSYTVAASSPDAGVNLEFQAEVVETSPGNYYYLPMSADLISRGAGYEIAVVFNDVCGTITIPAQGLGGDVEASSHQFSNAVEGAGSTNPETGVMSVEYTIDGLGTQIEVFTPND